MKVAAILVAGALAAATAALGAENAQTNSLGMQLVRIAPGEFVMGQGDAPPRTKEEWLARDYDESPAHTVRITAAFLMSATEVTNSQYEWFDPAHKASRGLDGVSKGDDEPVTRVSWQRAVDFCDWLARAEGKPYRLPTEAEWEYACRAGTITRYHSGDDAPTSAQANLGLAADGKRLRTVKVANYPPNAWGLHDMMGNAAEWCLDWHGPYQPGVQTDPIGPPDGVARVVRGWSYNPVSHAGGAARYARSANRSAHLPDDANRCTGFRVVQAAMPKTPPSPMPPPALHQRDVARTPTSAPARGTPHFVNYAKADGLPTIPKDAWGPVYAAWNHFSTVVVCPNGDVLAAWYTTVSEEGRECAQAASRLRAGSDRWEPASSFLAVADCNSHAPVLLSDGKRLYHFFTQSLSGWDDAADCLRTSDDSGATWSRPRVILPRDHPRNMSQPCSAFVAADGALVLAVDGNHGHRDERVLTSRDGGATWAVGEGDLRKAAGKYAIHPAVVQTTAGDYLAFLRGPDPLPAFVSRDRGQSWEPRPTPFPGVTVGQKAAALKLRSGALLLVSFDSPKRPVAAGKGEVFAALSFDDGKTWPHVRRVEGVGGYMSLAQGPDGVIYHCGSRMRAVAYDEAWLKEGRPFPPGD